MKLYDIIDCRTVIPGIPVSRDNAENWYLLIGEWQQRSNGNGRRWMEWVGYKVDLEPGTAVTIGGDNVARVMEGRLIYRRNQLLLGKCEDEDESRALITFRHTAPPRDPIASGSAHKGAVKRFLSGSYIDLCCSYNPGTSLLALLTVQQGSKLWVEEERELRVAGTGASLTDWFNFKKTRIVSATTHQFDFDGATSREILNTISRGVANEMPVSVEAWVGGRKATFSVKPSSEPGQITQAAIDALKLSPGSSPSFEEVAL